MKEEKEEKTNLTQHVTLLEDYKKRIHQMMKTQTI